MGKGRCAIRKHQRSRAVVLAMMWLVILITGIPFSATAGQKRWAVDLHAYGVKEWRGKDGGLHRPTVSMAATNNVVAVALGNPTASEASNERDNRYGGTWEVTLLLFDVKTGKLKKTGGPWSSDSSFELYPTAEGNFLLFLRHIHSGKQNTGETLYAKGPADARFYYRVKVARYPNRAQSKKPQSLLKPAGCAKGCSPGPGAD
jgi:hypothetical protein